MKCATFHNGQITPGIQTTKSDKKKHPIIFLGQKGNGGRHKIVFIDTSKSRGPEIDSKNMIYNSYPSDRVFNLKIPKTGEKVEVNSFSLRKTYKGQIKCLVRINTSTQLNEQRRINGSSKDRKGWPDVIAGAWGFFNGQKFTDEIWVMDDMDAIEVVSAGGGRDHRYVIYNDKGDLICTPEIEFVIQEKEREKIRARYRKAVTTVIEAEDEIKVQPEANALSEETSAQPGNELSTEEQQDNLSFNEMVDSDQTEQHADDSMSDAEIEDKLTPVNAESGNGPEIVSAEVMSKKSEDSEKSPDTQPVNSGSQSEISASGESETRETVIHDEAVEAVETAA